MYKKYRGMAPCKDHVAYKHQNKVVINLIATQTAFGSILRQPIRTIYHHHHHHQCSIIPLILSYMSGVEGKPVDKSVGNERKRQLRQQQAQTN